MKKKSKKTAATIPLKKLAIESDGYHLMAIIIINRKKAKVIVDTGASRTVFDKERIKHFVKAKSTVIKDKLSTGLGTNSMKSHQLLIRSLQLGKIKVKDYPTVLLDLSHVNHSYTQLGMDAVDGVLGSDLMHRFNAVIDFKKNEMKLRG
ncbi:MAG TPA: aspartyl protease family protein [Bacteroidia bacterium]|jgi:predicted aspartyl protease